MNRQLLRLWARACCHSCLCLITVAGAALAKPSLLSPGNGAQVPYASQVFSWTDNYAEGSLDHWYMEISTRPETDYYSFGFFQTPPVYAAGSLRASSVNLNAQGEALRARHLLLARGRVLRLRTGSNGVYWSPVQSFTVQGQATVPASPPTIVVNPTSLSFTVAAGDTTEYQKTLDVSNSGGTNMYFSYVSELQTSPVAQDSRSDRARGRCTRFPVRVSAAGLGAGSRSARVRIDEPAAGSEQHAADHQQPRRTFGSPSTSLRVRRRPPLAHPYRSTAAQHGRGAPS